MPGPTLVGLTGQPAVIPLLKLNDNGPATGVLKTVTDGQGNDTALKLSSSDVQLLALNNTPIGATTPSTGAFTTLSATGNVTIDLGTASGSLPSALSSAVVLNAGNADGVGVAFQGNSFSTTVGQQAFQIEGRYAGGTRASPAATPAGARIVELNALGFGTALTTTPSASFRMIANSLWSGTNQETAFLWNGTVSGSTTNSQWMFLSGTGLQISPAGSVVGLFTATGLAVTGTLTNSGNVGFNGKVAAAPPAGTGMTLAQVITALINVGILS